MSLIPPGFRKSTRTTEFYGTIYSLVIAFALWRDVNQFTLGILVVLAVASFNISRALYKRNRGLYSSCFLSGEWVITVAGHLILLHLSLFGSLERQKAAILIVVSQFVYNIGRGVAKGVGVKTQTIMR